LQEAELEDKIELETSELDIDLKANETVEEEILFTRSEEVSLETEVEDSLKDIVNVQNITEEAILLEFIAPSQETYVEGSVLLKEGSDSIEVPVTVNITEEEETLDYDPNNFMIFVYGEDRQFVDEPLEFSVGIRDEIRSESSETVSVRTKVVDEDGENVFEETEEVDVELVNSVEYSLSNLETGNYTVTSRTSYMDGNYSTEKEFELREEIDDSITGRFYAGSFSVYESLENLASQVSRIGSLLRFW